ncbi:MAG: GspE/PulE family protein, partial [Polyangiales bacterium]
KGNLSSIVARVKIEAGLNIAEKRLPQDGRITKKIRGKVIDVRVSTIPTAKGERVVMRILDKENIVLDLTDLGFAKRDLDILLHTIHRPNGIMLVTGPTGSGKTTTLYASLNKINTPDKNILTAEDPVEYELRGIGQLHVKPKIGLNFAKALRAFLRQDPDVIMVGEIRDHETADIAVHASLTGHLVLSTLHTNDAPGAITRLIEMGVKPFQISSSLLAVLAQRLVRRLCPHCKVAYTAHEEDLLELGIDLDHVDETLAKLRAVAATTVMGRNSDVPAAPEADEVELRAEDLFEESYNIVEEPTALHHLPSVADTGMPTFFKPDPNGCEECGQTGYRGRMGIYELMVIDEPVRKAVLANSDAKTIQRAARTQGMRTLREDGARQVIAGVTSVDEVLAATQATELEAAE